jgi:hypothetical protein
MRRSRVALLSLGVVAMSFATSAGHRATAAVDLAVADSLSYATPVGTVFRIPNQLDGGALLTKSTLTLDKAQATAAGYTPGELGEAFLQTSVVPPEGAPSQLEGTAYTNPSLITAQSPPSDVFLAETAVAGGGLHHAGIEAASIRATTTPTRASADAIGGLAAESEGALTFRSAGSRTVSEILADGTVVSRAHAFVTGLRVGGDVLRIGGIESTATVSVRAGGEPVTDLSIEITGAQVAGVPVVIDRRGIRLADTALATEVEVRSVNAGLETLAEQGLSIELFPGLLEEADDRSAAAAGAALSIRGDLTGYVPTAVDTPLGPQGSPLGDVGTDDEVLLGQVQVEAFAAERGPAPSFALPEVSLPPVSGAAAPPAAPAVESPTARATSGTPLPRNVASPASPSAVVGETPPSPFELIRREAPPGVAALGLGYRWVLAVAMAGVIALLLRRRAQLV